jgi:hypothetical protein
MTIERRHSLMGLTGGASLGLGIALLLFVYGTVPMTVLWLALIVLGMGILGWIFSRVIPARDAPHDDPAAVQAQTTPEDHSNPSQEQR